MQRLLVALTLCFSLLQTYPARAAEDLNTMTSAQIEAQAASLHPSALYVLAARLLAEGKGKEAENWMYVGQIRYRFLLSATGADGGNDRALFSTLTEQVGRPVNEYIAGDADDWIEAMRWALAWDESHANALTPKTAHAAELAEVRRGLSELIAQVDTRREELRQQRRANGLENR